MAKKKEVSEPKPRRKSRPASTLEGREAQLTDLALDVVEERMLNGTASSAEICHFLKLASTRNQLEKAKIEKEIKLMDAKENAIKNAENSEKKFAEAIEAFKRYSGHYSQEEVLDE